MAGPGIEPGTSDELLTALRGPGYKSRGLMVIIQVVPIFFLSFIYCSAGFDEISSSN